MTALFQIFITESELDTKTANINVLLGYPDPETHTTTYREGFQKYEGTEWAGTVKDDLVEACSGMTPAERLEYYDDSDLKTYQWLSDNDWFPPYE